MTQRRDSRGRRRQDGQERGLRSLYPELPRAWLSRALRISMPRARWLEFDGRVSAAVAETRARAAGQVLMALMDGSEARGREPHWLDFERDKARRLLLGASRAA